MAVSDVYHYGLLNRWAIRMDERIFPFNQIYDGQSKSNPQVYIQSERDAIAEALRHAVQAALYWMGFYVVPTYETRDIELDMDRHWSEQNVYVGRGYLQDFGIRKTTLVSSDSSVVYTDEQNEEETIKDTGTITVTTTADETKIQVFHRVVDGAPGAADERYRIYPVRVTRSGGDVIIKGHRALFVKPDVYQTKQLNNNNPDNRYHIDWESDSDFVTAVDVYTVDTDTTQTATLLSEPTASGTSIVETPVTAIVKNKDDGIAILRRNSNTSESSRRPYAVRLNMLTGYDLVDDLPHPAIELAIMRLANIDNTLDAGLFAYIKRDTFRRDTERIVSSRDRIAPDEYVNPLGETWGHFYVWRTFKEFGSRTNGHIF